MKRLTNNSFATVLIMSALTVGCASTDPYTPEHDSGFTYDNEQSFAMNVVDGSLGFHSGLKDSELPADSDTSASGLDYAVDGLIGSAFGGGIGGAVLSMLGTNSSNEPLNYGYGIAYISVNSFKQVDIDNARKSLADLVSKGAANNYGLEYINMRSLNGSDYYVYSGPECSIRKPYYQKQMRALEINGEFECIASGHRTPTFITKANKTPNGTTGKYVVFGLQRQGLLSTFSTSSHIPSISESGEFYYLQPTSTRNRIPFVYFNEKAHLFIKPTGDQTSSINWQSLTKLSPKLFEYK